MAVTTFRAGQTTYNATDFPAGGTRNQDRIVRDLTEFMDAPDRRDTPFLNSVKKGRPFQQNKKEWGIRAVNPRGSTVGAAGYASGATSIPVATGHGSRFQQGHVLWIEDQTNPANYEISWVTDNPSGDTLTVKPAQGGTTSRAGVSGDIIRIIGIAMPQLTDYPLGSLSRGDLFYNYSERFMTMVRLDRAARTTPDYEQNGDWLLKDAAQKSGDLKLDLEAALVRGRRQEGDPNPADPEPSLMSGILHFAELGGNILNVGGSATLLDIYNLEEATAQLDEAVGDKAGSKIIMNLKTKRIFNRLLNANRRGTYQDTTATLKWSKVSLETGDYEFTHLRDSVFPDGTILIYNPAYVSYHPRKGLDWQEEDLATKGPYDERAVLGEFTFQMEAPQTCFLINNFNTTLSAYPAFS